MGPSLRVLLLLAAQQRIRVCNVHHFFCIPASICFFLLLCLFVCLFACLLACLYACLFACLLPCLFAWMLACLLACFLACLLLACTRLFMCSVGLFMFYFLVRFSSFCVLSCLLGVGFLFVRLCSTSPPGGNQVDGLPPARHGALGGALLIPSRSTRYFLSLCQL